MALLTVNSPKTAQTISNRLNAGTNMRYVNYVNTKLCKYEIVVWTAMASRE